MLKGVINKFQYPLEMDKLILNHEEKVFILYQNIIIEKYQFFFEKHGYSLKIGCEWQYMHKNVCSKSRLPLKAGYSCHIYCEIQKKGDMITVYLQDEDIDNHPLFAIWEISRIDFPFNNPPYVLLSDINEIYEDMDELQELINKKVTGTSE